MTDEIQLCMIGLGIIATASIVAHFVYILLVPKCDDDDR